MSLQPSAHVTAYLAAAWWVYCDRSPLDFGTSWTTVNEINNSPRNPQPNLLPTMMEQLTEGGMSVTHSNQFHTKSSQEETQPNINQTQRDRKITTPLDLPTPPPTSTKTMSLSWSQYRPSVSTHATKLLRQTTPTVSKITTSSKSPVSSLQHLSNPNSPHQKSYPHRSSTGTSKDLHPHSVVATY